MKTTTMVVIPSPLGEGGFFSPMEGEASPLTATLAGEKYNSNLNKTLKRESESDQIKYS